MEFSSTPFRHVCSCSGKMIFIVFHCYWNLVVFFFSRSHFYLASIEFDSSIRHRFEILGRFACLTTFNWKYDDKKTMKRPALCLLFTQNAMQPQTQHPWSNDNKIFCLNEMKLFAVITHSKNIDKIFGHQIIIKMAT